MSPPKLSLNRGYRAPIIIESSESDDIFLSLSETDLISRYDAWRRYTINSFREYIATGTISSEYHKTFLTIIASPSEDLLYQSYLISFPTMSTLLNALAPIDPILLARSWK